MSTQANCLVDMLQQHVLPSVRDTDDKHALLPDLSAAVITLKEALQVQIRVVLCDVCAMCVVQHG